MIRSTNFTLAATVALMFSAMSLAGCATAMDGATEDIKIEIAGAGEALCDVTQPGRRYRAYAPSTFRVMKSPDPLHIRCFAPGNREASVVLNSTVNDNTAYNVSNAGIGAGWDYMTGATYQYPNYVMMDFSNVPSSSYPLPDYQTVFAKNPELTGMEQFNPGIPALISDQGQGIPSIRLRDPNDTGPIDVMMPRAGVSAAGTVSTPSTYSAASTATPVAQPTVLGASPSPSVSAPGTVSSDDASSTGSSSRKLFTNKIGTLPSNAKTVTSTSTTSNTGQ